MAAKRSYGQHSRTFGPGTRFKVKTGKGSLLAGKVFVCLRIEPNVIKTGYDTTLDLGDLVVFDAHFTGKGLKGPALHAVPLDWCEPVEDKPAK